MKNEATGQTLQPTALVHEAYVRLVGPRTLGSGTVVAISLQRRQRPCAGY